MFGFSYIILPEDEYKAKSARTIVRSVVRLRDPAAPSVAAPVIRESADGFQFYDRDGNVLEGDDELSGEWESVLEEMEDEASSFVPQTDAPTSVSHRPLPSIPETLESELQGAFTSEEPDPSPPIPIIPDEDSDRPPVPRQRTQPQPGCVSDNEDDDDSSVTSQTSLDMAEDVNQHFQPEEDEGEGEIHSITGFRWVDGIFELKVKFTCRNAEYLPINLVRDNEPMAVAEYILSSNIGTGPQADNYRRWARWFMREVKRTLQRLHFIHTTPVSSRTVLLLSRRATMPGSIEAGQETKRQKTNKKKAKKPGANNRNRLVVFGVKVPRNYAEAVAFDKENNNRYWQDAVMKEMSALIHHKCFEFKSAHYKPSSDFQYAPLCMIYKVKHDLWRKARFVIQGHRVDPRGLSTRATVVKGVSVRLLDVIAHRDKLIMLQGDIGNAFIQAFTSEKCFTRCGPEFGPREGCVAIIVRALYGLTTSAERWQSHFADFLRNIGFVPTQYDKDVWMRDRGDSTGYNYICTHVDDFKVIAKDPTSWMNVIKKTFLVKSCGPPDYYLGNNYVFIDDENIWTVGCQTYLAEAIRKVEAIFGVLPKNKTPLPVKDDLCPELDSSPLLGETNH